MKIERVWAMPNKRTFEIPPIEIEEASKIQNLTKKELSPVTKEDYAVCGVEE